MNTELHMAFVFDCDSCGTENFVRCIEGDLPQEAVDEIGESFTAMAAREQDVSGEGEEMAATCLISRVFIAPRYVTCKVCGRTSETEIDCEE